MFQNSTSSPPRPPQSNNLISAASSSLSPNSNVASPRKGRKILLASLPENNNSASPTTSNSLVPVANNAVITSPSSSPSPSRNIIHQQVANSVSHNNGNNDILEAMSLSAWPSSHNGDLVLVLNRYIDDQTKRIDGDTLISNSSHEGGNNNNNNNNNNNSNTNNTNYRAVARCEVLKTCCTAFEHHFHSYKSIFTKMSAAIDVLSNAFEQHYKTNQQVDQWKQQVMKREDVLRDQMKSMVEHHEREYATEADLKRKLVLVEQNLLNAKNDLDHTYRAYVRAEESLKDANERNDQLSRQHVMLTLRESRMRDDALNLERQVEVSHQHAESKAREVGELRQDFALLNGKLYRAEAKIREVEMSLQTATQTLQRKSRDLEEKEMELARLAKNRGRIGGGAETNITSNNNTNTNENDCDEAAIYSEKALQDKIKEALADREKESVRATTPRPDWELLFETYQTRNQLLELVKPSEQNVVTNSAKNAASASSKTTPLVSSKRWTEMLTYALQNSCAKNQTLIEEVERRKEQADSAELQLALSVQQQSGGSHSKSTRIGGGAGKSVRAGGAGLFGASTIGPKSKQQQKFEKSLKNAAFVYVPLASPDYLRTTKPVPGRMWQQGDIYKVLSAAIDFIIANSNNNNNNNNFENSSHPSPSSSVHPNPNNNNGYAGGGSTGASLDGSFTFGSGTTHNTTASPAASSSPPLPRRLQHRQSSISEAQLHQQLAGAVAAIDQQQQRQFADAFNAYLVASFADGATRREMAYNIVYHCRQTFPNDVFCRSFLLSLGGDVPADSCQRIRTFVMSFRRSCEVCDSRCSGYIPKKTAATLVKNLMSMYSATEHKIVLALLDDLPQMASRSETLIDYRVLFSNTNPSAFSTMNSNNNNNNNNLFSISINGGNANGGSSGLWERPTQFMTLVAAIFFRGMLIDMEAAINAVKNVATIVVSPSSGEGNSPNTTNIANTNVVPSGDISVGALLSALQSCDQKRDYDIHKEFMSKCIITPSSSIHHNSMNSVANKAMRIPLELLIPRMRRTYLPRASIFPADPRFQYPESSHVIVVKDEGGDYCGAGGGGTKKMDDDEKQEK